MAPVHSEFGARMTDRDQIADVRIEKPGVRFQPLQREIVAEARQIADPERGAVLPRAGEARAVVIDVDGEGVRDPLFRGELQVGQTAALAQLPGPMDFSPWIVCEV